MQSNHPHAASDSAATVPSAPKKKYFCPMCDGVESDKPGSCPKCGMALERNPTFREPAKTIYTLPDAPADRVGSSGQLPDLAA